MLFPDTALPTRAPRQTLPRPKQPLRSPGEKSEAPLLLRIFQGATPDHILELDKEKISAISKQRSSEDYETGIQEIDDIGENYSDARESFMQTRKQSVSFSLAA